MQLFEYFSGFLVIKESGTLEFIPVVNKTKNCQMSIPLNEIKYVNDHRFMFKPIGLEVFVYYSNESYLFVFEDNETKETVKEMIISDAPKILEMHLDLITKMWMNGYLSNYDYLIYLNRFSSRSFNDISQYPIFPWVISEYSDDEFKLNVKNYYRDLGRPIGALNKNRLQKLKEQYDSMKTDKCKVNVPYLYNSFYSTPG